MNAMKDILDHASALSAPMDRAGVLASTMALMRLMDARWGFVPVEQWTPEVRSAYLAMGDMVRHLLGE